MWTFDKSFPSYRLFPTIVAYFYVSFDVVLHISVKHSSRVTFKKYMHEFLIVNLDLVITTKAIWQLSVKFVDAD